MEPSVLLALHKYHVRGVPKKGVPAKVRDQEVEDDLRAAVGAGEHSIDALVRVRGAMSIQPDQENVAIPQQVAWMKVACLLFSKLNGVTLESVLREVEAGNGNLEVLAEEFSAAAQAAMARIKEGTRGRRRGAVSVQLELEEVLP